MDLFLMWNEIFNGDSENLLADKAAAVLNFLKN